MSGQQAFMSGSALPSMDATKANRFLATLSQQDYSRLVPHLRTVALDQGTILQESGGPVERVYFPTAARCRSSSPCATEPPSRP
jgi:hypothetical protein